MKKIIFLFFTIVLICSTSITIFAAREMCEGNYQVAIKNEKGEDIVFDIKSANITAYSPFRTGDVGTGSENFVAITSQFNQPRAESVNGTMIERSHKGVDMRSINSNYVGRPVFLAFDNAKILTAGWRSGYGNTVVAQHKYTDADGKEYFFQTLYAHLEDGLDVSANNSYEYAHTVKVGTSGNSGLNGGGIHLHLEFRTATDALDNSIGAYAYAPSVFYWRKGAWGNNTSFINAVGYSGNTVQFEIVSYDLGQAVDVLEDKVKIYHKLSTESSFRYSTMTKSGNIFSYTFNTSMYPSGSTVQYYIQAQERCWNGTYYSAYRPYYYRESSPPPASECLTHVMVDSTNRNIAMNYSKEALQNMTIEEVAEIVKNLPLPLEPSIATNDTSSFETANMSDSDKIKIGAHIISLNDKDILVRDIEENKEYTIKLMFKLDHTPKEGAFYWITGTYDPITNSMSVETPEGFHCPQRYAHTD